MHCGRSLRALLRIGEGCREDNVMERMITKELLIDLASKALQELDRNDCRLLSVSRPPAEEDPTSLVSGGFATPEQIAPIWCVVFLCEGLKPLIVGVRDLPGVTNNMIRNELMVRLREYAAARAYVSAH